MHEFQKIYDYQMSYEYHWLDGLVGLQLGLEDESQIGCLWLDYLTPSNCTGVWRQLFQIQIGNNDIGL